MIGSFDMQLLFRRSAYRCASVSICELLAEDSAEHQTDERAAVAELPQKGCRKVHTPSLDEGCKGRIILEQNRCNQAHDRAHDRTNAEGNRIGDELRTIRRAHDLECEHRSNLTDNEELQNKSDRPHNRHLVQSGKEGCTGNAAHVECNVVADHTVYHTSCHDNRKDSVLKFVLRHFLTFSNRLYLIFSQ